MKSVKRPQRYEDDLQHPLRYYLDAREQLQMYKYLDHIFNNIITFPPLYLIAEL